SDDASARRATRDAGRVGDHARGWPLTCHSDGRSSEFVSGIRREILAVDPQQPITRVNFIADLIPDSVASTPRSR
ncbi:MAG: hypothetical protein ACKVIN_01155, partial [Longimicrobiales bacterium]